MSVPFFSEGTAPRRSDTQWKIATKILGALLDVGVGGGLMPGSGSNYRFHAADSKLELLNSTTGLYNAITDTGAAGSETIGLDVGEA